MLKKSRNLEIKAVSRNFSEQRKIAESLTGNSPEILKQEDYYFNIQKGRLKLRITSGESGQLIYYERPDQPGPKVSLYQIYNTSKPNQLLGVLSSSYGIRSTVIKTRFLYLYNRSRIHLDNVENLGEFIELEVVMDVEDNYEMGMVEAHFLIEKLDILEKDFVDCSYIDLVEGDKS